MGVAVILSRGPKIPPGKGKGRKTRPNETWQSRRREAAHLYRKSDQNTGGHADKKIERRRNFNLLTGDITIHNGFASKDTSETARPNRAYKPEIPLPQAKQKEPDEKRGKHESKKGK